MKVSPVVRMEDVVEPTTAKNPFARADTNEKTKSVFNAFSEPKKRSSNK